MRDLARKNERIGNMKITRELQKAIDDTVAQLPEDADNVEITAICILEDKALGISTEIVSSIDMFLNAEGIFKTNAQVYDCTTIRLARK